MAPAIALLKAGTSATESELGLARSLNMPLLDQAEANAGERADFILQLNDQVLELRATGEHAPGPLRVDFSDPKFARRTAESLKKQNLGKAIGLKSHPSAKVLDATAGLGTDGFIMAMAGCSVTLLERSAVVAALLQDGLNRGLQATTATAMAIAEGLGRMRLVKADFMEFPAAAGDFDVVYLDPMFPGDARSARSKKPMFMLQELLAAEQDGEEEEDLLARALQLAARRVVVKRARLSPVIAGPDPDIQFKGSSSRFDVYLTGSG